MQVEKLGEAAEAYLRNHRNPVALRVAKAIIGQAELYPECNDAGSLVTSGVIEDLRASTADYEHDSPAAALGAGVAAGLLMGIRIGMENPGQSDV